MWRLCGFSKPPRFLWVYFCGYLSIKIECVHRFISWQSIDQYEILRRGFTNVNHANDLTLHFVKWECLAHTERRTASLLLSLISVKKRNYLLFCCCFDLAFLFREFSFTNKLHTLNIFFFAKWFLHKPIFFSQWSGLIWIQFNCQLNFHECRIYVTKKIIVMQI